MIRFARYKQEDTELPHSFYQRIHHEQNIKRAINAQDMPLTYRVVNRSVTRRFSEQSLP